MMFSVLSATLPLVLVQASESAPLIPFDRVVELEISEYDEPAIEGRGPTAVFEYESEFEGTLHIWTDSDLDLFLRVDDAAEARSIASDDNSGGGTTPYVALDVQPGDWLVVLVAGDPGATGTLNLHLIAVEETEAGRAAAKLAWDVLGRVARLFDEGEIVAARELITTSLPGWAPGGEEHRDLLEAWHELAGYMQDLGDLEGARSLREAVLRAIARTLPADHPDLLPVQNNLALTLYAMGDLVGACDLRESVLAALERSLPADHPQVLLARSNLAVSMHSMGDLAGARALRESVLAARESSLPRGAPELLGAKASVAASMQAMGDSAGALALRESIVAEHARRLPADHPDLLLAQENVAISLSGMGELAAARALLESILAAYERNLPDEHPDLLRVRQYLAGEMYTTGDLVGAHALWSELLAAYERNLPEDHPTILFVRVRLAGVKHDMGDMAGARALRESNLASCERSLPAEHLQRLDAGIGLAISMHAMGDLADARTLNESVLAACESSLPADHPKTLIVRANLAGTMQKMGDLAGARALRESILTVQERRLPADHLDLVIARVHLAESMESMGDVAGGRALRESILAVYEARLPADHYKVLNAKMNLANTMGQMGDVAAGLALWESSLAGYERSFPEDHPAVLRARANLALALAKMGDLGQSRRLLESVLAGRERSLPASHPDLQAVRATLASVLHDMGDLDSARSLRASVLATQEASLPADHPDLLSARGNLAISLESTGERPAARALLPAQIRGMRARILGSLALAPRQARQTVTSEGGRLSEVLFLSDSAAPELERSAFELIETMRLVAAEAARSLARFDGDPELAPILSEAGEVRRALNDLVAAKGPEKATPEQVLASLTNLSLKRDRLEREASRILAERGVVTAPVEAEALAAALRAGEVAVGYRRISPLAVGKLRDRVETAADHMLAHVVTSDGKLVRLDLGLAAELEELAIAWRAALGAPIGEHAALASVSQAPDQGALVADTSRGIASSADRAESVAGSTELTAGRALRHRILDPVLAAVGPDVTRLFVCADDLLFLLPLDALPLGDEGEAAGRVGDRFQLVSGVSFARFLSPLRPSEGEPSLLSLGGVDYDASGVAHEGLAAGSAPIESEWTSESGDPTTRSAAPGGFQSLAQARVEAEATAALFERAFDTEPALLTRQQTTKAALFENAPGKRYVHLATHGWFAPESVRSTEDAQPDENGLARMGIEERVSGLAPMTLCGLALAGANNGRNPLGRVPGILTAEELCSLDLSQCELAVLSACETNVGIRRAGQGIQSLQSALYAAGARTSITSLWNVDDAATRRLMEVFYTNLWIEGLGKAEALWQAKRVLRDVGHPPAHWAGWVLTGDPE